jgi:glycosyltransferase involved in cell wall biosynthesis
MPETAPSRPELVVIIPVRNEAVSLPRCLHALSMQTITHSFRVLVSANACTDSTVEIAETWKTQNTDMTIEVVVTTKPGKTNALNAAEARMSNEAIRVYLDSDVILQPNALFEIEHALSGDGPLLCAPAIRFHRSTQPLVRSYFNVMLACPGVNTEVVGLGCYAVNEAGRRRWSQFPVTGSDDTFVRLQFDLAEQLVLRNTSMLVFPPERIIDLLRARARWSRSREHLRHHVPTNRRLETRKSRGFGLLRSVLRKPQLLAHLPAFIGFFAIAGIWGLKNKLLGTHVSAWRVSPPSRMRMPQS